jgi:hypothetical protein
VSWLDRPAANGDRYLSDAVRLLWPEPAELATGRRRPSAHAKTRTYLVVPSARRPKVLIPARPRRAAGAAIRGFKSTQGRREAWLLAAVAGALHLGAGSALPDRLHVAVPHGEQPRDLETMLSDELGRPLHLSLHVSHPRAVRKPVLQVIDSAGRTFAFAKVGIDEFTNRLVREETRSVQHLSARRWRVLAVPSVLYAGVWEGHDVLVQEAFTAARGAGADPVALAAAMSELARCVEHPLRPLAESTFWTTLVRRIEQLPPSETRETLARSAGELATRHHDDAIEFGCWHGDWAPWNMNVANGRVRVWDWEKFATDVPIGFDAAHFTTQQMVVAQRRSPVDAFGELFDDAPRVFDPLGVPKEAARLVAWLYVLHLATIYVEDGEPELGRTSMSRLDTWLGETLRRAATC